VLENAEAWAFGAPMFKVSCICNNACPLALHHRCHMQTTIDQIQPCYITLNAAQGMLLPVVQQLHGHPCVRLLLTSRVQLGEDLPTLPLAALSPHAAATLVLDSVRGSAAEAYCWNQWHAEQLARNCATTTRCCFPL